MNNVETLRLTGDVKKKMSISNFDQYMKLFSEVVNTEDLISKDWEEVIQFYIWSRRTGKPPKGMPIFRFWLKSEKGILHYEKGEVDSPDVKLTIAVSNIIKIFKGQLNFPTAAIENKINAIGWVACLWKIQTLIDLVMEHLN